MRWLFHDENNRLEIDARNEVIKKIDAWWLAFESKTGDLDSLFSGRSQWDLPEWMAANLQVIAEGLMWEYGSATSGSGHRLVITPESSKHLRPLTATIIERAPKLVGWEFYPYRLAENAESAQQMVEARTGGDLTGVRVNARIGEHHLVDLTFQSPRTKNADDQQALNDAFVATETLLGEELLDKWVGLIEVASASATGKANSANKDRVREIQLDQLKDVVESLVVSLQDQLPHSVPVRSLNSDDDAQWSCIELTPVESEDYPQRSDLIAAITLHPTFWMAAHSGLSFYSERFCKNGEVFAYIKIDRHDGDQFIERDHAEAEITKALTPDSLGGVIGGGTGIRYTYIDVVLTNRKRGIKTIQDVLQNCAAPLRSWILFFDAELCDEWIGIYDNTPNPPKQE